jgi:hypothetical protein
LKTRLAAVVLLAGVLLGGWWARQPAEPGPCRLVRGPAAVPDLPEASGLAISRRTPGLLWSHNDSGNAEVLVALDASGAVRGRVQVPVRMRDWEDVSAAPCPAGTCLYIADIGDNALERPRLAVYRLREPSPDTTQTVPPDRFSVWYADGRHNAEAAFVADDRLFVVPRDRRGGLYRSSARFADGGELELERIGELGLAGVSDAETSPDGAFVIVRTPREAVMYRTQELLRGAVVPRLRIPLDDLGEPQGEGVAIDASGMLFLASEGRRWTNGGTLMVLQCRQPS